MRKPITLLILIMAHVPLLMGKRNRHNRDAAKKPDKGHCASDFCLPNNYNSLELPSSDKQIVAINLEVNANISSGATFVRAKREQTWRSELFTQQFLLNVYPVQKQEDYDRLAHTFIRRNL